MEPDDFQKIYNKHISVIGEVKDFLKSIGQNSGIEDMDSVLNEAKKINKNHLYAMAAIKSMPPPDCKENTEELYQQALKQQKVETESSSTDSEDSQVDTSNLERSLVVSQTTGIPIDPITQNLIKSPARNKICNHVYENSIILAYLEQTKKRRMKKKKVKCPHIGCSNDNIQPEQIFKDEALKKKIKGLMVNNVQDSENSIVDLN